MSDFSENIPFFDNDYHGYAASMLADFELTPGLPRQFHYQEIPRHPTYSDREKVAINLSPFSDVPQISQREPIIGHYDSMVYDVPFDPIHDEQKNIYLISFGFGFLLLSMALL